MALSEPPEKQPQVGIFFYVWYDTANPASWDKTIVDTPTLGRYDSDNTTVISQQLKWIEDLGIDFVIVSWWGTKDNFGKFTDQSAKLVFQTAQNIKSNLKFAIMVEPYPAIGGSYNYQEIYSQIYRDFVAPYASLYYVKDDKPLICFYNDAGKKPSLCNNGDFPLDAGFTVLAVGEAWYTDWMYTDLVKSVTREDQVSVTPRYDESRLKGRPAKLKVDPRLNLKVYDQEWQNAIDLWEQGKVDTVLISTWNEYYERTAIEPHIDATAANKDPNFLYTKTKNYITQLRLTVPLPTEEPTEPPNTIDDSSSASEPLITSKDTPVTTVVPEYPAALALSLLVLIGATAAILVLKNKRIQKK